MRTVVRPLARSFTCFAQPVVLAMLWAVLLILHRLACVAAAGRHHILSSLHDAKPFEAWGECRRPRASSSPCHCT